MAGLLRSNVMRSYGVSGYFELIKLVELEFDSLSVQGCTNRIPVIASILGQRKGVLFSRGCISLKNWSYRPLLRDSTSPFKRTCLLIRVKEDTFGLYCRNGQC
jgi:hypothetical protein